MLVRAFATLYLKNEPLGIKFILIHKGQTKYVDLDLDTLEELTEYVPKSFLNFEKYKYQLKPCADGFTTEYEASTIDYEENKGWLKPLFKTVHAVSLYPDINSKIELLAFTHKRNQREVYDLVTPVVCDFYPKLQKGITYFHDELCIDKANSTPYDIALYKAVEK